MNEVVNGLAALSDPPELAILPHGTGWDFVRTFGIPRGTDAAVEVALTGAPRTIDLGRVTYRTWDGHEAQGIFANVASAGMSGAIAQRANGTTKALGGKASYLLATVAVFTGWSAVETRVTVDGEARSGRMFDVVVANGRSFGGGMKICPEAEPDDGLFDVVTIGDVTKRDLVRTMPKIYRGTYLPHPKAEALRGRTVTIETDEPVPVQLDGEQPGTTPCELRGAAGRDQAARATDALTGVGALRPGLLGRRYAELDGVFDAGGFRGALERRELLLELAPHAVRAHRPRAPSVKRSSRRRRRSLNPLERLRATGQLRRASPALCSPRSASLEITSRSSSVVFGTCDMVTV